MKVLRRHATNNIRNVALNIHKHEQYICKTLWNVMNLEIKQFIILFFFLNICEFLRSHVRHNIRIIRIVMNYEI